MSDEPRCTGRPTEFGDLSPFTLEQTEFRARTETPVRCFPVSLGDMVIGYLWASETEDAADFRPRRGMGAVGYEAGGPWRQRLKQARDAGFTAYEAVQLCVGDPEDPRGGHIPADAEELSLPNFEAVLHLAAAEPPPA